MYFCTSKASKGVSICTFVLVNGLSVASERLPRSSGVNICTFVLVKQVNRVPENRDSARQGVRYTEVSVSPHCSKKKKADVSICTFVLGKPVNW